MNSSSSSAVLALVALVGCKSPSETSAPATAKTAAAAGTTSARPEECAEGPLTAPSAKPIRFSLSNAGGDRVCVFLERLSGKKVKIAPDAEPALKAVSITIDNHREIEPKVAVGMMVDALKSKGLDVEEGPTEWQVRRAPK